MCEKRLKVNLYFKKKNLFLLNFFYKIKQDKKLGILYQTNIKLWKKNLVHEMDNWVRLEEHEA